MAPSNFLRLFTIFSLAILNTSFDALPANALAVEPGHMARGIHHAHAGIAKKRSNSKQCKPRPVPSASAPMSSTSSTTSHLSHASAHLATPTSTPSSQLSTYKTTTATSPSSTPSAAASSSGSCNKKVGLNWSNHEETALGKFVTPCTYYISNWNVQIYDSSVTTLPAFSRLEFVPTIHDASYISQIKYLTRGYARKVKGWNEPDIGSQSNLSPNDGCILWQQHIDPLTQLGYELIAPAVTTSDQGFAWLQAFMNQCKSSKIHRVDIHHYSLSADELITAVNKFHDAFAMDIWVGEVGCVDYSGHNQPCTQDIFNAFFSKAVSFMESAQFVEMYAWFGLFTASEMPNNVPAVNSMITCTNSKDASTCVPNALGQKYLNP